jgi:phenylalanyl-tRNA synthetase beta chain
MKVSLSWLRDYVQIEMTDADLAEALTMAGLEVEEVIDRYAYLETVIVGRVLEVRPHPNADRLRLCSVENGKGIVQVVCGAPNVAEGMFAPLAQVGTQLPNGIALAKAVIRGESSEGMLCSETELALGLDGSGILDLGDDHKPGTRLAEALNLDDTTFEIGLTPNRPDCLSLMGVAREIAAIEGKKMAAPDFCLPDTEENIDDFTSVTIEAPDHCPRYAARLLDRITVGPSPFWLQDRLRSVGIRPINNLVDVTNFVMMETGQPLHAFDFDHLAGQKIIVRTAAQGEPFTTLDQKERQLTDQMLMICDGEKPVAVGGVMGGLNSEIEETTTRVLLESACFDPVSIRKTAKALQLNTDASHRFERGVDPDGTLFALDRAASLMAELGKGRLIHGTIDEDFRASKPPTLSLNVGETNRLLGTNLDRERMASLLNSIEFVAQNDGDDSLTVTVPSFRVDVTRSRDLMEEVARLSGYNEIPTTFPALPSKGVSMSPMRAFNNCVKDTLVGFGFLETINYSFISAESCDRLRLGDDDPLRSNVALLNPISEEQSVMRTSLIPGMLETTQRNISRQQTNLRLFETGKVFLPRKGDVLPCEKEMLVGLWTGLRGKTTWYAKDEECDFFDAKGSVESLARALGLDGLVFKALPDDQSNYTRNGHAAQILSGERVLGFVGEMDESVLNNYGIKQSVFVFELDLESIRSLANETVSMSSIPRFPSTARDITVIVDEKTEAGRILETIEGFGEALVTELYLFDIFTGDPVPAEKKSVSLRVVYQASDRTLEDETVNRIHQDLTHRLIAEFGATLPT